MTNEAAQLNVLISGGFAGAYEQLLPEFQRMSGIKVTTGSGERLMQQAPAIRRSFDDCCPRQLPRPDMHFGQAASEFEAFMT